MFIEIVTHAAVTGAFEAYEHRTEISQLWNRFAYVVRHRRLAILILGPGGVGKSRLARFLCAPAAKFPPQKYDESFHVERQSLPGNAVADLVTAPGQKRHAQKLEDLFDEVKKRGRTFGIINVVAYGYQSTALDMKEIGKPGESIHATTQRYLDECRAREEEIVVQLVEHLRRHTKPFWMITLVTKQDLWWPQRKVVEDHYKRGPYAAAIEQLRAAHQAAGFTHEYFSMATQSQNFVDGSGHILEPTAQGYDDIVKYAHQNKFLEILRGFIDPKAA